MQKNVIAGLGEIGTPILKILSKNSITVGYDINPKLIDNKKQKKFENLKTSFLHICIPYSNKFNQNVVSLFQKFQPSYTTSPPTIVISTGIS